MRYVTAILFAFGFLLIVTASARSEPEAPTAICASTGNGNWSIAGTWNCGRPPRATDDVVIASGHTVTLDTDATINTLTVSGTLTFGDDKTDRTLSAAGNVQINSSGTIDTGKNATHVFNIGGDFTNNGSFTGHANSNRVINVTLSGARLQIIAGAGTTEFNDLTIAGGTRAVFPAANLPTVNGIMTVNSGGAVQQTQTVNNGTVNFLQISTNIYRGVDLTTANNLGSTTVVITTTTSGGCTTTGTSSPAYATRCYEITPANNLTATVRLFALTSTQLNGVPPASLRVYHYAAGSWQPLTTNASTGSASGGYSYAQAETPGFSDFLLGGTSGPTALMLSSLDAQSQATSPLLLIGLALLAGAAVLFIKRRAQ